MTINLIKGISLLKKNFKGYKLYDLYKEANFICIKKIFRFYREINTIFSTPFDESVADH